MGNTDEQREAEEAVLKEVEREYGLIFAEETDFRGNLSDREDMLFQAAVRREVEIKRLQSLLAERDKEVERLKMELEDLDRP